MARPVWRRQPQVLQELAVNLRRKARKPLDAKVTRDVVTDYMTWHVVLNGRFGTASGRLGPTVALALLGRGETASRVVVWSVLLERSSCRRLSPV